MGASSLRGYWHSDICHTGRLDVLGQYVFLRDQPVQDRNRELRAGGQHQGLRRSSYEVGDQVCLSSARHGYNSHVL